MVTFTCQTPLSWKFVSVLNAKQHYNIQVGGSQGLAGGGRGERARMHPVPLIL